MSRIQKNIGIYVMRVNSIVIFHQKKMLIKDFENFSELYLNQSRVLSCKNVQHLKSKTNFSSVLLLLHLVPNNNLKYF